MQEFYDEVPDSFSTDEIRKYLALLWYWSWLIILAAFLAGAAGYYYTRSQPLVYQSSTLVLVNEAPSGSTTDYSSLLASERLTETYSTLMKTEKILKEVVDLLGLDMSPDALAGAIDIEPLRDTQLIKVTVTSTDPEEALRIANSTVGVFSSEIEAIQSSRFIQSKDSLETRMKDLEAQIESLQAEIDAAQDPIERDRLDQKLNLYESIYAGLLQSYEQVRLVEAQSSASVTQVQPATLPDGPAGPSLLRNTFLAVILGGLLATGAVFLFNALDDTIKNPDEVRQRFNVTVLGLIESHKVSEGTPISELQPRSSVAESFRALRTNLMYTSIDQPLKTVMITSPTPQVGKSTVVSNLGTVFAQGERKVVLVDADMRRPQLHRSFNISNQIGLSNLFMRPKDVLFVGAVQTGSNPNLGIISSGGVPPNPAELLTSQRMSDILGNLAEKYDLVLVDTPPVLTVTDASALAPVVDGVIVVIKPGVTRYSDLQQTLDQVQRVGGRLLGVVLNEVNPRNRRYGYYYSRYYTRYSYAEPAAKGKSFLGGFLLKPRSKTAGKTAGKPGTSRTARQPFALFKRR